MLTDPGKSALLRGAESAVITAIVAAALLVLPQIETALSSPQAAAQFDWRGVLVTFALAAGTGIVKAVRQYLENLHLNQQALADHASATQAVADQAAASAGQAAAFAGELATRVLAPATSSGKPGPATFAPADPNAPAAPQGVPPSE